MINTYIALVLPIQFFVISFILCKYMLRFEVEKTLLITLYVGLPKSPAEVEVLKPLIKGFALSRFKLNLCNYYL